MSSPFIGTWTYRSFQNNPELATPFELLEFGRANLVIEEPEPGTVGGTIGGTGWSLALQGSITADTPDTIRFQGTGEIGGETWVYDYHGFLAPHWPAGVNQRPAVLGTIIRTAAHSEGQAPAGVVASWIAVRRD